MTVVNACSSGTDAIGVALTWLKSDLCDLVIAGGADELSRIPYCGFSSLGLVNPDLCAPFDRDRKGLNLGEGAGVLIIEKKSLARRRGVRVAAFPGRIWLLRRRLSSDRPPAPTELGSGRPWGRP